MENNSNSGVIYQGKIPNRVKYCFAFGALGKDLIYGMIATFSMIYFTDIIKVDLYDGVFPLPDPSSPFNNGVEQMEKVSIPVQYKFDGQPLTEVDSDTLNQALEVLQNADIYKMTNEIYSKLSVSGKILSGINV